MSIDTFTLSPDTTVLDVISRYRQTEDIFKRYDTIAGECICCRALFESLDDVAKRYGLDRDQFLSDLEAAINIR